MEIQGGCAAMGGMSNDSSQLAGGWATPLKNMKVSWNNQIPNIWKPKKKSKPPTSEHFYDQHTEHT